MSKKRKRPSTTSSSSSSSSFAATTSLSRNVKSKDKASKWLIAAKEIISKNDFKSFKTKLKLLSSLQKSLLDRGNNCVLTEKEKRESDDILRSLIGMMSCEDKVKRERCIFGFFPMIRQKHLKIRYKQIAASRGVLID
jgi:hypothetical protein